MIRLLPLALLMAGCRADEASDLIDFDESIVLEVDEADCTAEWATYTATWTAEARRGITLRLMRGLGFDAGDSPAAQGWLKASVNGGDDESVEGESGLELSLERGDLLMATLGHEVLCPEDHENWSGAKDGSRSTAYVELWRRERQFEAEITVTLQRIDL